MQQGFRNTAVADYLVTQVAGDSLRALAPEQYLLPHVHHAQPGGQAFEDVAAEVWVVK